jgi:hypothetical protein
MRSYKVKKGKHDFKPTDSIGIANPCLKEIKYKVIFTESCKYILPGEDQDDWNKGGGVSFSLLSKPGTQSCGLGDGGRKLTAIQLCAYWHGTGLRIMPKPKTISRLPAIRAKKLQFRFAKPAGIGL